MESLSVEAALQGILAHVRPLPARPAALDEALGRVLAEDIQASENLPPFPNSAVDGFAVRVADVATATREHPARLKVLADAPAGTVVGCEVMPGTAVRIMTGAELPPGTESVVPVEETASTSGEVQVFRPLGPGLNLRLAGEDVRAGERVMAAGTVVRPAEIGLLAALGRVEVPVVPAPRVAVLTTGAELVEAGAMPGPGQIRDANIHGLGAQVRAAGALCLPFPRVPDTRAGVEQALRQALASADVVLTNGGVSVGDYDFVRETLGRLGAEPVFVQVAQKPGRPLTFWLLEGKPVFGLPGNPVAAMVCFELYVRPALRRMMGLERLHRPRATAKLAEDYRKGVKDPRTHWLRVQLQPSPGGWVATRTGPQGSGILSSMTKANAIAEIPALGGSLKAGDDVTVHLTDLPEDH